MNRYRNTSSVSEMLDHLNWETLESKTKAQLTMMFRIVNRLVDVTLEQYLTPASSRTRSAHSHKFRQISAKTLYYKKNFFPHTVSLHGILCYQLLLRLLTWYPSSRGCPPVNTESVVGPSPPPPPPKVPPLGHDPGDRIKIPSDMFCIFHL